MRLSQFTIASPNVSITPAIINRKKKNTNACSNIHNSFLEIRVFLMKYAIYNIYYM